MKMLKPSQILNKCSKFQLYFVTDSIFHHQKTITVVSDAIKGGIDVVQLREKNASKGEILLVAHQLRQLTWEAKIPLIINDYVDVALEVQADGVHVGQEDGELEQIRSKIGPDMILGISAGTIEEVDLAVRADANYLGVGAIFQTSTKADAGTPIGIEGLKKISAHTSLPIIAIGGICTKTARKCITEGNATGVAVVSAISSARCVLTAAQELRQLLH